jgi:hypothetical protein
MTAAPLITDDPKSLARSLLQQAQKLLDEHDFKVAAVHVQMAIDSISDGNPAALIEDIA